MPLTRSIISPTQVQDWFKQLAMPFNFHRLGNVMFSCKTLKVNGDGLTQIDVSLNKGLPTE
jgi:hypothetical protein